MTDDEDARLHAEALRAAGARSAICRKASPAIIAAASATLSERKPSRIGTRMRASALACTCGWRAGGFPAEKDDVMRREGEVRIGAIGLRGREHQAMRRCAPPCVEGRKARMARDLDLVEIIHAGAAKGAVGDRKARRLDDVERKAETGREPRDRARVLRNVRLQERKPHRFVQARNGALARAPAG